MLNHPCPGRAYRAPRSSHIFFLSLLTLAATANVRAQQAGGPAPIVPQNPAAPREVRLTLTVTNEKDEYIGGIEREHVEVFEGKTAREITSFGPAEEHASVGVLFDITKSMRSGRRSRIEQSRQAFARFVQHSSPNNEYFLSAFNKYQFELTGWTRDHNTLREGLDKLTPANIPKDGDAVTALYDACVSALAKISSGSHPQRVLLIFTDGADNNSRQRLKDVKRLLRASDILLYVVSIIERGNPSSLDTGGQVELDELASASGGRAYFPDAGREVSVVVDRIAMELRSQYVVRFAPADEAKKGELNKVKIRIKPPPDFKDSLRVRAREGYLTP